MALSTLPIASPPKALPHKQGFRQAIKLFREAAKRIPAYKDFLKKNKIKPDLIESRSDFSSVPATDKTNYIGAYPIAAMCWDGSVDAAKYISSSSGSTGIPLFWPRGRKQDIAVGGMFRRIYEDVFNVKNGTTLSVDSFALGSWIAGFEFFNATKWVSDLGNKIVLVTPGIDKATAIHQIKKLVGSFDRIVLGGYPPFVKDILELGAIEGVKWRDHDVRLFTGGEAVSEHWRDRMLLIMGKTDPLSSVINMYGMAETGIVGFETPLSIAFRRAAQTSEAIQSLITHEGAVCPVYQYDPAARYFEESSDHTLMLTTDSGIPLVRYDTRDTGGLIDHAEGAKLFSSAKLQPKPKVKASQWQFPFVYLHGRRDFSISLYALNIYSENVKHALEGSKFENHLSGLFTMSVEETQNLDQVFQITIELSRGTEPSLGFTETLTREIIESLCALNTEYAKLYSVIGERAKPRVSLVKYGEIQTTPGRKHKWVKRS